MKECYRNACKQAVTGACLDLHTPIRDCYRKELKQYSALLIGLNGGAPKAAEPTWPVDSVIRLGMIAFTNPAQIVYIWMAGCGYVAPIATIRPSTAP